MGGKQKLDKELIETAIEAAKKVSPRWLRDPDVVAVDVGLHLEERRPVRSSMDVFFKTLRGRHERIGLEEVADELGQPISRVQDEAEKPEAFVANANAELERLGKDLRLKSDVYENKPWIRVHLKQKLDSRRVDALHREAYHRKIVEHDDEKFYVHVVEALYQPTSKLALNSELDEAFHNLCSALDGELGNFPKYVQRAPEAGRRDLAVDLVLQRLEIALDRRYPSTSLEGGAVEMRQKLDPLTGGISIGTNGRQNGSLGAIVWDKTDCKPCILTCWHVLDGGRAQIGDRCLQPSVRDGGTPERNTVARLKRSHLGDNVDAALAELNGTREFAASTILRDRTECSSIVINGISEKSPAELLETEVWKCGRSSGVTKGFIDGVGMSICVHYPDGTSEIFHDQLHIVPISSDLDDLPVPEVSKAGDSGSIWLDDENRAVGLNFAGDTTNSTLGDFAVANRITDVERQMKISFTPVFQHPRELARRERDAKMLEAIVRLQSTVSTDARSHQMAELLSETFGQIMERFDEADAKWVMDRIGAMLGPIGLPESRPGGPGG